MCAFFIILFLYLPPVDAPFHLLVWKNRDEGSMVNIFAIASSQWIPRNWVVVWFGHKRTTKSTHGLVRYANNFVGNFWTFLWWITKATSAVSVDAQVLNDITIISLLLLPKSPVKIRALNRCNLLVSNHMWCIEKSNPSILRLWRRQPPYICIPNVFFLAWLHNMFDCLRSLSNGSLPIFSSAEQKCGKTLIQQPKLIY